MKVPASLPFVLGGVALGAALLWGVEQYRYRAAPLQPMLPVLFEHADHKETPCADCHHNFLDGTGSGPCYLCHKTEQDTAPAMEQMFHDFCFDCHATALTEGEKAGPPRQCAGCHGESVESLPVVGLGRHIND